MALGPQHFNCTIALQRLFQFFGQDQGNLVAGPDSEPSVWVFMVKIDGEGMQQRGNFLSGGAKYFFSAGSHGNIGGSMPDASTRTIPPYIVTWTTSLQSIPISVAGQQLTSIPGVIFSAAV